MKSLFRKRLRGGGNRSEARDIVREVGKVVKDDRAIGRQDDKFETEKVVLVDSGDEHESIVGWAFQPNNETDIDAKMPRGKDAWSVSVELIFIHCNCIRLVLLDSFA